MNAQTKFKTQLASRYLGKLCNHFGHKVPLQLDGDHGRIGFQLANVSLAQVT